MELDPERMDGLIQRCEDQLFPENQSRTRWSDVLERAASNARWPTCRIEREEGDSFNASGCIIPSLG